MGFSRQAENWIRLLTAKGLSGSDWMILRKRFTSDQLVEMAGSREGVRQLERLTGAGISGIDNSNYERHLKAASENRLKAVTIDDNDYPELLRQIESPPPVIFYRGRMKQERLSIAVVGSRSAGRRGLVNAERISRELSERGVAVVSGMARGVDTAAHRGALQGGGVTVAVVGCGLDIPYPPENSALSIDITRNGCVMTEFMLGTPPLRHHFPMRNRIISGLCRGVVIVEAGIRSGAMITSRWAADQGREVFAVPGPVEHPGSAGPHKLIKEGAVLVENADDILGFLDPFCSFNAEESTGRKAELKGLGEMEKKIMNLLELEPMHIDFIARELDTPAEKIMPVLLRMEIEGYCRSFGGGMFVLEKRYGISK